MARDIMEVVTKVDLELLKYQTATLDNVIVFLTEALDKNEFDEEEKVAAEIDRANLEGLLEFLDNVIISLEDL